MKRWCALLALLIPVCVHAAWEVTEDGGVWSGSDAATEQTATLTVPVVATDDVTILWDGRPAAVSSTISIVYAHTINTGSWRFQNGLLMQDDAYVSTTGAWTNDTGLERWNYSITEQTWTQVIGGDAVWGYNETTGKWEHDPSGTPSVWSYDLATMRWTHEDTNSTWQYNYVTGVWAEVITATGLTSTPKPPAPVWQQMYLRSILHIFLNNDALVTGGSFGWSANSDQDLTWSGTNEASDEVILFDTTASGKAMTWHTNGTHTHQKVTTAWQYDPIAGGWAWQNNIDPLWRESWGYDSETTTWKDDLTSEEWSYTVGTRTWAQGDATWQYAVGDTNFWTTDTSDKWEYDPTTGEWTYDPDGSTPWTWKYHITSNDWTQVTNNAGEFAPAKPPTAVVQFVIIQDVKSTFQTVGAFAEDGTFGWQAATSSGGVWTMNSINGKEQVAYTPTNDGAEVTWSILGSDVDYTLDVNTGAWFWHNGVDTEVNWTYDARTNRVTPDDGGEYWAYTASTQTWVNEAETIIWAFQTGTQRWRNQTTGDDWQYGPSDNSWRNTTQDVTWRYDNVTLEWYPIINAPSVLPATSTLPPVALVQQVLIGEALEKLRTSGAFSTGELFGFTMTAQGDDMWSGDNATGDQRLTYDPERSRYTLYARNVGAREIEQGTMIWEHNLAAGNWRIANTLNPFKTSYYTYTAATGVWQEPDGSTPWQWLTNSSLRWYNASASHTWTLTGTNTWLDSKTSATWTYTPATGRWANGANSTTWKFDPVSFAWAQMSGTTVAADNMPPLPVVTRMIMSDMFVKTVLTGVFVSVTPLDATLLDQEDGSWLWTSDDTVSALTFTPANATTGRLVWATTDDSRAWQFDPATGQWAWQVTTTGGYDLSWTYNPTTKVWSDAAQAVSWQLESGLIWKNSAESTEQWQYDPVSRQWKNLETNTVWGYQSKNDVWVNITVQSTWSFDEKEQEWQPVGNDVLLTTDLPPEVVRQMTLIHVAWRAAISSKVFAHEPLKSFTVSQQSDDTWTAVNGDDDVTFTYNTREIGYPIESSCTALAVWAQESAQWRIMPGGNWEYCDESDPFVSVLWSYDADTGVWQRGDYSGGSRWEYNVATRTWTDTAVEAVWEYLPATQQYRDNGTSEVWEYDTSQGNWWHESSLSRWSYDPRTDAWTEVTAEEPTVTLPPRVVAQDAVVQDVMRRFIAGDAFDEAARMTWQANVYSWRGIDSNGNGSALYDARRAYQLSWHDTYGLNRLQYATTSGEWKWRYKDERWWYNPTNGLWGTDARVNGPVWQYVVADDATTWSDIDDATSNWTMGANAYTWKHDESELTWMFDATTNEWMQGDTQWLYNFANAVWVEVTDTRVVLGAYPPLPLVQQKFIETLYDSMNTFFAQPLYWAAQQTIPVQHQLFGSRPLTKDATYDRYAASSILVNADINLDHVWWVHNDVSRGHGRLQVPSTTTAALPTIIGGDRAALFDQQWAPAINLYDSTVACHEPLVSAGVRWNVHERPLTNGMQPEEAHNFSAIMGYNKGRVFDMPLRRGAVFQLGSTANRMADGSITASMQTLSDGALSTSTLRDAFLDVYRAAPTVELAPSATTTIELALKSAQEDRVNEKERAHQVLYCAHRSRVDLGWPLAQADKTQKPWQVTSASIEAADADDLFTPSQNGGGVLKVAGHNWVFTGRNSNNKPPVYPILNADQDNVLYANYGGTLTTSGAYDVLIDTIVARRVGTTAASGGRVVLSDDQVTFGPDGRVQPYEIDFAGQAQTSGQFAGHVLVDASSSHFSVGRPLSGPNLTPIKSRDEKRKSDHKLDDRA